MRWPMNAEWRRLGAVDVPRRWRRAVLRRSNVVHVATRGRVIESIAGEARLAIGSIANRKRREALPGNDAWHTLCDTRRIAATPTPRRLSCEAFNVGYPA